MKKKFVVVLVVGAVRRVDPMVRAHEGKEIGRAARTLGLLHSHSHARSAASADVVSAPVSLWLERSLKTSYCKSRNPHSWPRNGSVLGIIKIRALRHVNFTGTVVRTRFNLYLF